MLYVIGGFTNKDYSAATNRIDIFWEMNGNFYSVPDPKDKTKQIFQYIPLSYPAGAVSAVLESSHGMNTVLITGGIRFKDGQAQPSDASEVITEKIVNNNLSLDIQATKTSMPSALAGHQSLMLSTQRVLILGGITAAGGTNTNSYLYTFQ
jgi:hypothetical protein